MKTKKKGEKLVEYHISEFRNKRGLKKEEVLKCYSKIKINEH